MHPLMGKELVKQLFSFGGSFRKEAIGFGTFIPATASVINTWQESGVDTVTGDQWAFLIGSTIALIVHLNGKRLEAD